MDPHSDGKQTFQAGDKIENWRPLPKLPVELQLKILKEACLPLSECLELIFEDTHEQWDCDTCREMLRNSLLDKATIATLDSGIRTTCKMFYEEAYKIFYKHHVFVFNKWAPEYTPTDLPTHIRDPRALHLLRFIDMPTEAAPEPTPRVEPTLNSDSKPPNVPTSVTPFKLHSPEDFRASVQHLVLCVDPHDDSQNGQLDWSWPLMVDWTTLPKLKTLCLDIRAVYHRKRFPGGPSVWDAYIALSKAAQRMKCLDLDKLIIVGACSDGCNNQLILKILFSGALSKTGKLELKDWDRYIKW